MHCKKCGGKNLKTRQAGPHIELFCGDCLAFQKFLSRVEAKRLESMKYG